MSCGHPHHSSTFSQTLEELDFERGIWHAALYNDQDRVAYLLGKGTNVNIRDNGGYTALHYASRAGHLNICRQLLNAGADVNAQTRAGRSTALHRAAMAGHKEIALLLLKYGADQNILDADGKNSLQKAVENGNMDIYHDIKAITSIPV